MEAAVDDFLKEINELAPEPAPVSVVSRPSKVAAAIVTTVPPAAVAPQRVESLHDYQVAGTSWTPCFDQTTGCPYYWNHLTNQVSWQPPPEYIAAVQAARKQQKIVVASVKRGVASVAHSSGLSASPKSQASKSKYPWEGNSDSEDEKIELITSFGPQSGDESEEELKEGKNTELIKNKSGSKKALKKTSALGPKRPYNTVAIGPQLPTKAGAVIGPQLPGSSEDTNEVYETSSLLTPLVPDEGPPGVENLPDSSTLEFEETTDLKYSKPLPNKSVTSPQLVDPDLSDDEDIICRLKSRAKILEKMGGEVPPEVKELFVPTAIQVTVKSEKPKRVAQVNTKPSAPASSSFALIASYGDDSDSEEQTPLKKHVEGKALFPSAVDEVGSKLDSMKNRTADVRPLFPSAAGVAESKSSSSVEKTVGVKPLFPSTISDTQTRTPGKINAGVKPLFPSAVVPTNAKLLPCAETTVEPTSSVLLSVVSEDEAGPAQSETSSFKIAVKPSTSSGSLSETFTASEVPDSTTTHKAFQRKRRIEFERPVKEAPIARYNMDPTSNEHRGFGFSNCGFDEATEKTEKPACGGSINFVKGEVINFQPSVPEKLKNCSNNLPTEQKTQQSSIQAVHADEMEEIAAILKEKLLFLGEGKEEVSAVQLMAVQLETLVIAWQQGALTPSYLSQWLSSRSSELSDNEQSAAPAGWTCVWDRERKRYCYQNNESREVVWDYPEISANSHQVSAATEPEQTDRQEEIAMELSETPPRASSAPPTPEPPGLAVAEGEPTPPPPPLISPRRSTTPPPPPPPMISKVPDKSTSMEVSSSTTVSDHLEIPFPTSMPSAVDEPLPPGVDDVEIDMQPCPPPPGLEYRPPPPPPPPAMDYRPPPPPPPPDSPEIKGSMTVVSSSNGTSRSPRKRSLLSELDSFYSDLAMLEADPVTTSDQLSSASTSTPSVPVKETKQTLYVPPTQSTSREDAAPVKKKRKANKLSTGLALKKKGFNNLVAKWEKVQKEALDDDDDDVSSTL